MSLQEKMQSQSGISLLAPMCAIGVLSIVATLLTQTLNFGLSGQRHLELRADKEAIRRMILDSVSCYQTKLFSSCPITGPIALLRTNNDNSVSTFISNIGSGTKIGDWTIRAECNSNSTGFIIRAARIKAAVGTLESTDLDDFRKDPLTGKVVTWQNAQSLLFGPGIDLCTNSMQGIKKIISGTAIVHFADSGSLPPVISETNSPTTHVAFPSAFTCNNPKIVTHSRYDSIACKKYVKPINEQPGEFYQVKGLCYNSDHNSSQDLVSRVRPSSISSTGFDVYLSTLSYVCILSRPPPSSKACLTGAAAGTVGFEVDYIVTCDQ